MDVHVYNVKENDFVNAMQALVRNNITTTSELQEMSVETIERLNGVGAKRVRDIKTIQKASGAEDVFETFRVLQIKPKTLESFFKQQQINAFNILSTKLFELVKKINMTPSRITAYTEYKNKVFRYTYNNTLQLTEQQDEAEITETLSKLVLDSIQAYIPVDLLQEIKKQLAKLIEDIMFTQINLENHAKSIAAQLDFEPILSGELGDFDKELLYQVILEEKEISMFHLKQKLQQLKLFNMNELMPLLTELAGEGFIQYTQHGIKVHTPLVTQYIEYYKEEKFPNLYLRMQGKTLEEIGNQRGVTRERIRQISKREMDDLPLDKLYETRLKNHFQTFDLTQEEFCNVFTISEVQYNFLKLVYDVKKEKISKEELLEGPELNKQEKERLLDIINKDFIVIDNHQIRQTKYAIVRYAVSLFAKETTSFRKFHNHLLHFCERHEIEQQFDFQEIRPLEGILMRIDTALWTYGKRIRHYAVDKDLVITTLKKLNFNQYFNQEISTRVILQEYEELFDEIEIYDEYELHNLLKKYQEYIPDDVVITRMPNVEVGEVDREEQVLNFLIEHSPIHRDDFVKLYAEKYGTLPETFRANHMNMLKEFEVDEILDADTPPVSDEVLNRVRSLLKEDFYFKEDVYQLYKETFGDLQLKDYIFPLVGYSNFAQFILKDTYSRADVYFEEKYFSHDIFTLHDNRINYLGSFRNHLAQLRESFDLFEFAENEFISFALIHEKTGIKKEEIEQVIAEILDEVNDRYFTIPMIEPIIEKSTLHQLGFEDIFYESLLKGVSSLRYQIMGGTIVFQKTIDKFYIHNFIEELVTRSQYIDIYDLMDHLREKYSINLSKAKIIQTTEDTDLYYHPIMEMMFQDIEQFYELMEGK